MVARGRGKKAASAAVSEVATAEAVVANGDGIPTDSEADSTGGVSALPAAKKGRGRVAKKDIKEEADEVPSASVEVAEKPTKAAKAPKATKKAAKGKAAAEAEIAPSAKVAGEKSKPLQDAAPSVGSKPAAAEKKTQQRKRKNDASTERVEEEAPVAKKAPKTTKTKAAKKQTVDSAGVPEDPAASVSTPMEVQTNGNKKASSRKRAAPKVEEPAASIVKEEVIEKPEEPLSAKKKKPTKKDSKKAPLPKSKRSKKDPREEDAPEDDILPEDEFHPEDEEEATEEPKAKKVVKSKGSRKQLKDNVEPPVAEEISSPKQEVAEQQDSTAEPAKAEKKTKGKKSESAKKAPAKKVTAAKKPTKAKKAVKDGAEQQDAGIETSEVKLNGNAKPKAKTVESKPGRGRKRASSATPTGEADEAHGSKNAKLEGSLAVRENPIITEYNLKDFSIDKDFSLKIASWNIAGLRAWLKKDGLEYLDYEQPDILCLQEIKCTIDQLPEEARIPGYHPYWLCMPGGHAGVAVYSKIMPIHVEYGIGNAEQDEAGRIITAEYEKFYLICVYVPNSGRKLVNLEARMRWEQLFRDYVQRLDKTKPVIIAGDMNVSHNEIDLANPKTNTKNAGFTPQERDAMTKLFELGYVDTFRHLYPQKKGAYSFWSYMGKARSKNVGWRLDYFIVSERIKTKIVESTIRPQVLGSDHCPITLFINI